MQGRPRTILDVGVNYCDFAKLEGITDFEAAKLTVDMVAGSVHDDWKSHVAVKFQWYSAELLAKRTAKPYWDTKEEKSPNQFELFKKYGSSLSLDDYGNIADHCRKLGMEFMCTTFDPCKLLAIDDLVRTHKIASADITNYEMLEAVRGFEKPVVLSTGASTEKEIEQALAILKGCEVTLLHCVLRYPTPIEDAQLWKIKELKRMFPQCRIGYSDHCLPSSPALLVAQSIGAEVLEKHFTATPQMQGNDHYHAVGIKDLPLLMRQLYEGRQLVGSPTNGFLLSLDSQKHAREQARRGVYMKHDVAEAQTMIFDQVDFLRPQGTNISPMEFASKVAQSERYSRKMKVGEQL